MVWTETPARRSRTVSVMLQTMSLIEMCRSRNTLYAYNRGPRFDSGLSQICFFDRRVRAGAFSLCRPDRSFTHVCLREATYAYDLTSCHSVPSAWNTNAYVSFTQESNLGLPPLNVISASVVHCTTYPISAIRLKCMIPEWCGNYLWLNGLSKNTVYFLMIICASASLHKELIIQD